MNDMTSNEPYCVSFNIQLYLSPMTKEIKRIHKNISGIYDGSPWYGDNVCSYLSGVSAEMAARRPEKLNHSIAEIVAHMTAWRCFVIEKMKGHAGYEVWDTERNWKKIISLTEEEWQAIKDDLLKSQTQLLLQIEQMPESILNSQVDDRKYNFRLLLQGIAQHDIYHTGQISMIKKWVS
jgi:uncharacterized damage-inducible protein DinB